MGCSASSSKSAVQISVAPPSSTATAASLPPHNIESDSTAKTLVVQVAPSSSSTSDAQTNGGAPSSNLLATANEALDMTASRKSAMKSGSPGSGGGLQSIMRKKGQAGNMLLSQRKSLTFHDAAAAAEGKSADVRPGEETKADLSGQVPSMERRRSKLVRRGSPRGLMNQLALKFPLIRNSFQAVHSAFESYSSEANASDNANANGNLGNSSSSSSISISSGAEGAKKLKFDMERIRLDQLSDVLARLATHKKFSEDDIKSLFSLANLDGSKTISFREFLIIMCVGYYLKIEIDSSQEEARRVQKGFQVVQQAFRDMDDDGSNTVDLSELKRALFAVSDGTESGVDKTILEARFRELDFNGDGGIEFQEFLYGFVSWVGFMDDDDSVEKRTLAPEAAPEQVDAQAAQSQAQPQAEGQRNSTAERPEGQAVPAGSAN